MRLPGLIKYNKKTLKRGLTGDNFPTRANGSPAQQVEAAAPEAVKPKLKPLQGRRKPQTLTLKRGDITAAAAPASKKANKVTGLNKQADVTMKRGSSKEIFAPNTRSVAVGGREHSFSNWNSLDLEVDSFIAI